MPSFKNICFKTIYEILILGLMVACSSSGGAIEGPEVLEAQEIGVDAPAQSVDQIESLLDEAESSRLTVEALRKEFEDEPLEVIEIQEGPDPAEQGLLKFFPNVARGVVVLNVDWDQALSQNHPGIDCRLKSKSPGFYSCLVSQKNEKIVVSVWESLREGSTTERVLSRITWDGQGSENHERLGADLRKLGFAPFASRQRRGMKITSFQYAQKTLAELIWIPNKNAFTLILRSLKSQKAKAKAKGRPKLEKKKQKAE